MVEKSLNMKKVGSGEAGPELSGAGFIEGSRPGRVWLWTFCALGFMAEIAPPGKDLPLGGSSPAKHPPFRGFFLWVVLSGRALRCGALSGAHSSYMLGFVGTTNRQVP